MDDDEKCYSYFGLITDTEMDITLRPFIDIEVGTESGVTKTFKALVDSGSDITILDAKAAQLLGITSEGKKPVQVGGVTNKQGGFFAPISLKVDGFDNTFNLSVIFKEETDKSFTAILGQQDFFRNFIVRFDKQHNKFYLTLSPTEDQGREQADW